MNKGPAVVATGATTVAAVIGSPVRHSLSPAMFNAGFREAGLDWVYVAFEVPPGGAGSAMDAVRLLGLGGCSVTMPHKADVADAVDELDADAARLHAVNCVVPLGGGRLAGRNTDGTGFVRSLEVEAALPPAGRTVALLGAGGAAKAVALALARSGVADLAIVNRTPARAQELVAMVSAAVSATPGGGTTVRVGSEADAGAADLVVNASSVGMAGTATEGRVPIAPARLHAAQVVVDLVYHPLDTPLLRAAREAGARTVDGVGMLLHQAALAFTAWTGTDAPLDAMRTAARAQLLAPAAD